LQDSSCEVGYYDALRGLEGASGLKDGGEIKPSQMSITYMQMNQNKSNREEIYTGSLTERAQKVITSEDYIKKLKEIKRKSSKVRYMDFVMDGIVIGMPYNGQKTTQGYLKKETQSLGIMLKRTWQLKYCVLDLTQFLFKYAKNPTEVFTNIHLKEILDVFVEEDPEKKERDKSLFTVGRTGNAAEGFNFQIKTTQRVFRLQAHTKIEQLMWVRSFAVLFELRARVLANLNTKSLETIKSMRSTLKSSRRNTGEKNNSESPSNPQANRFI